jgi:hypothetical protein
MLAQITPTGNLGMMSLVIPLAGCRVHANNMDFGGCGAWPDVEQ